MIMSQMVMNFVHVITINLELKKINDGRELERDL